MERVAVGVGIAGLVAVGVRHVLATEFVLMRRSIWNSSRDLQTLLAYDMNGARPSIRTGHHAGCVWNPWDVGGRGVYSSPS